MNLDFGDSGQRLPGHFQVHIGQNEGRPVIVRIESIVQESVTRLDVEA